MEYAADALPLSTQANLLSISRRSLYYQPKPPPPEEVAIKHRIDEIYTAHPFYGSRKLTVLLEPDFAPINRKRVQRYMREMGIAELTRIVVFDEPGVPQRVRLALHAQRDDAVPLRRAAPRLGGVARRAHAADHVADRRGLVARGHHVEVVTLDRDLESGRPLTSPR